MEKMKPTAREIVVSAVFIAIIGVIFVLNLVTPSPAVLVSERRVPARFPELNLSTISNGDFMDKFEDYAADHFVFRDAFRGINTFFILDLYQQTDKSGLYRCPNVGLGEFRSVNKTAFRQTTERVKRAAQFFDGYNMNIYYTIIPDKSTFAARYMPGFDLETAEEIMSSVLGDYEYIQIANQLTAESFYKTDLHWNQTEIGDVANMLLGSMGAGSAAWGSAVSSAGEWRGLYAGQLALPYDPDTMKYVDLSWLKVSYINERTLEFEQGPLYEPERITGVDPYDVFMRGPQPLIIIENAAAPERELYLFRDSFGSSLAPLLACSYSKITVIDLRYIHLMLLDQLIEVTPESDVLFIYSSQIFNNPSVLQTG